MFSIAAINDANSIGQYESLAPTKEAQEFHLIQTYHDGLLKLQAKEYGKAQELLEAVLKDPLVSSSQVSSSANDEHLLQLRFLALKNLATVFLEQGSAHYESAVHCYLQAVEIDTKDSVIWNKLGTLACSMGSLSISRWAFEQGLVCSPNNWNCMEKLLEVLIAIRDEISCLSVSKLILRHWPSHPRALHVKNTIEELELIPFQPRGIDKLEPKHAHLKFLNKRKAADEYLHESRPSKNLKQNLELHLKEATWVSLADALLGIMLPVGGSESETEFAKINRSGNKRLIIHLPSSSETATVTQQNRAVELNTRGDETLIDPCCSDSGMLTVGDEMPVISEEQRQERRSVRRLEKLKGNKSGEDETYSTTGNDRAKFVMKLLESFLISEPILKDLDSSVMSTPFPDDVLQLDKESNDISIFLGRSSKNHGAYHVASLILEEVASRYPLYQHTFVKFLDLEKVTRQCGKDRTPECYLFLAELYYDLGLTDPSKQSECMLDVSYLICKIIELLALDYPFPLSGISLPGDSLAMNTSQDTSEISAKRGAFWVRFFWLSGRLSVFEGDKSKANEEFCIALSFLAKKDNVDDPHWFVNLPHCKFTKDLTIDRILHQIELLKVDFLMKTTLPEMIGKEMYLECIDMLSPLIFSNGGGKYGLLTCKDYELASLELSALDVLIKSCEEAKPMNIELYLNCHRQKLQILMKSTGTDGVTGLCKTISKELESRTVSGTEGSKKMASKLFKVAEEVKEISRCASQVKTTLDAFGDSNSADVPLSIVGEIQHMLLAVMCNIASLYLHEKSFEATTIDPIEENHKCCFVDSAIAFCKLQHLNQAVPFKMQVDLLVAMHGVLAEYGLCCASNGGGGEEGMFLKFSIKHLLANKAPRQLNKRPSPITDAKPSSDESNVDELKLELVRAGRDPCSAIENDVVEDGSTKSILGHNCFESNNKGVDYKHKDYEVPYGNSNKGEKSIDLIIDPEHGPTEAERAELEEGIDNALDQCFFCLYGLNLRSESSYEDDIATHRNSSIGDYQTKEQCADVFQYVLSYAKNSSKTGLVKIRRVLRAIRKHFPQPPGDVLSENAIDKFLDDPNLCEEKLSEEAGSDGYFDFIMKIIYPNAGSLNKYKTTPVGSSEPYAEVYSNLYYLLAETEETSATDKPAGFILTKEGEEFVQQNANLFKYDLMYNPLRFESWQRLANIFDEEVDLLLNDGSKHLNVAGWRKSDILHQRVETSRRRSRCCLLVSLALAKTPAQQGEIHEMLALVYYDGLQNVTPICDQRSVVRLKDDAWKMFCMNSLKHFEKAWAHKQDWSLAFYMGKLSEKLGYSHEISFSYYYKAIALNPSAVDPVYRLHASRVKALSTCGKEDLEALKASTAFCFNEATKKSVLNIFGNLGSASCKSKIDLNDNNKDTSLDGGEPENPHQLREVWRMLYDDCLSALQICVEGDLKHFHKARYTIAKGIYKRGESTDLAKAKDELSFCFKSSRSSFTINMWEIDGTIKKGRRKAPSVAGNKKFLEVNLPESSRKFITCLRKYMLFYLRLLEETGDISTLDRAYIFIRTDKRFSLCLEDLIPVAVGRYIKALIYSMEQAEVTDSSVASDSQYQLERIFTLFTEQVSSWPSICSLPEIEGPDWSESKLYGYLYQYIQLLERNNKVETLESINEKIRKRFKNSKLSNSNCARVCRHTSIAWCRSLIYSLAQITIPSNSEQSGDTEEPKSADDVLDNAQLLFIEIKTTELWSSSFEGTTDLKVLVSKWSPILSKLQNVLVKKVPEENTETANNLLKCAYNFYRDSCSVTFSNSINLYLMGSRLATTQHFNPGTHGVEILDLSIPRKLLVWAYTLSQGRFTNISAVVKYCEETLKLKMKKGCGTSFTPCIANIPALTFAGGGNGDYLGVGEIEMAPIVVVALPSIQPEGGRMLYSNSVPHTSEHHKSSFIAATATQLHQCDNKSITEKSNSEARPEAVIPTKIDCSTVTES